MRNKLYYAPYEHTASAERNSRNTFAAKKLEHYHTKLMYLLEEQEHIIQTTGPMSTISIIR